jgi:L-lactate dehydrogenase
VHAYVVGEHGDSEVLTWSLATIGVLPLDEFCRLRDIVLDRETRDQIEHRVRSAAYSIIDGKGATYYGIGSALARILEVILTDQRSILTICTPTESVEGVKDVTVALPRLLGGNGVLDTFPQPLNTEERAALRKSAQIIKDAIVSLDEAEQAKQETE